MGDYIRQKKTWEQFIFGLQQHTDLNLILAKLHILIIIRSVMKY